MSARRADVQGEEALNRAGRGWLAEDSLTAAAERISAGGIAEVADNHKVTVVDLDGAARLLRAKREALLAQLDAIDRALTALTAAGIIVPNAQELPTAEPAEEATSPIVPTRVKPRRVLSDEHRYALTEGRRKARHAKDAAAGRAREAPDPASGLAPASTATDLPRLVKRHTPGPRRS